MSLILITGGTGLIGSAFVEKLRQLPVNICVLTRNRQKAVARLGPNVKAVESLEQLPPNTPCRYVVNLAGESIGDKSWSMQQKLRHWQSRVELTNRLVVWMHQLDTPPEVLLSGSAIGWYGDGGDTPLDESSAAHHEYTHSLCDAWEKAALKAIGIGTRVCILRTGLVLSRQGGILGKMRPAFQWGLGARFGSGQQYMSWIHLQDWLRAAMTLLDLQDTSQSASGGVFNLTAPNPVTNAAFCRALANQLHRPCLLRLPARVLGLIFGEMSRILVTGQRVLPVHLQQLGFEFRFEHLEDALRDLYGA